MSKLIIEMPNEFRNEVEKFVRDNAELEARVIPQEMNMFDGIEVVTFVVNQVIVPMAVSALYDFLKSKIQKGHIIRINGKKVDDEFTVDDIK